MPERGDRRVNVTVLGPGRQDLAVPAPNTRLYRTVQGHLETYLALARTGHEDGEGAPPLLPEHMRSRVPQ